MVVLVWFIVGFLELMMFGHRQYHPEFVARFLHDLSGELQMHASRLWRQFMTPDQIHRCCQDMVKYSHDVRTAILHSKSDFVLSGNFHVCVAHPGGTTRLYLHDHTVDIPELPAARRTLVFDWQGFPKVTLNKDGEQLWGYSNRDIEFLLRNPLEESSTDKQFNPGKKVTPFSIDMFSPASYATLNALHKAIIYLGCKHASFDVDILRRDGRICHMHCIAECYLDPIVGLTIDFILRSRNILDPLSLDKYPLMSPQIRPSFFCSVNNSLLSNEDANPQPLSSSYACLCSQIISTDLQNILINGPSAFSPFVHRELVASGRLRQYQWMASQFILPDRLPEFRSSLQLCNRYRSKVTRLNELSSQSAIDLLRFISGCSPSQPSIVFDFMPGNLAVQLNEAAEQLLQCSHQSANEGCTAIDLLGMQQFVAPNILRRVDPSDWRSLSAIFVQIWFSRDRLFQIPVTVIGHGPMLVMVAVSSSSITGPIRHIACTFSHINTDT